MFNHATLRQNSLSRLYFTIMLQCTTMMKNLSLISQHLKTKNTKTFYCLFQLGDHSIPSDVIIKVLIKKIEKHRPKSKVIKGR